MLGSAENINKQLHNAFLTKENDMRYEKERTDRIHLLYDFAPDVDH